MKLRSVMAVLGLALAASVSAFSSDDHPPGKIEGEGIQLFERNHGFAGEIGGMPVFGAFDHEPFGAQASLRRGEKTLSLKLDWKTEGSAEVYSGLWMEDRVDSSNGAVTHLETPVRFVRVAKTGERSGQIKLMINGAEVAVDVVGEAFENNHFHNPSFAAKLPSGKVVAFKFTGEACFGYSTNLAMMILSTISHLEK